MLLTCKAKKDFESWVCRPNDPQYVKEMHIDLMYGKSYIELYAYIIEFFHNKGLYITIGRYGYMINIDDAQYTRKTGEIRLETTKQAIIKANEIYNNR